MAPHSWPALFLYGVIIDASDIVKIVKTLMKKSPEIQRKLGKIAEELCWQKGDSTVFFQRCWKTVLEKAGDFIYYINDYWRKTEKEEPTVAIGEFYEPDDYHETEDPIYYLAMFVDELNVAVPDCSICVGQPMEGEFDTRLEAVCARYGIEANGGEYHFIKQENYCRYGATFFYGVRLEQRELIDFLREVPDFPFEDFQTDKLDFDYSEVFEEYLEKLDRMWRARESPIQIGFIYLHERDDLYFLAIQESYCTSTIGRSFCFDRKPETWDRLLKARCHKEPKFHVVLNWE
jgi:hypothetical protein